MTNDLTRSAGARSPTSVNADNGGRGECSYTTETFAKKIMDIMCSIYVSHDWESGEMFTSTPELLQHRRRTR